MLRHVLSAVCLSTVVVVAHAGAPASQPQLSLQGVMPAVVIPAQVAPPVIPLHVANAQIIRPPAPLNPGVPPRRPVVIGR